jgi:SAM-dependent methyltransferase
MALAHRAHREFERWRRHFPASASRARNTIELAPWYWARWKKHRGQNDAYADPFWDFHDNGDWRGFASLVLQVFPDVRSVVDVGCGQGLALSGFATLERPLVLRGFDDSPFAIARAKSAGLAVEPLDIVALTAQSAKAWVSAVGPVDLALCLEVAEHLPAWHARKLLDVLTCARYLVFSAAHPNQGGTLHVNERLARYWIDRLALRGFRLAASDEGFRTAVAGLALPGWYAQNVHAFEAVAVNPGRG